MGWTPLDGIETAKLSGLNPEAYLADILGRIRTHDPKRLDELLPWTWKADGEAAPMAA
jgi:transposase